ncbi:MAG: hypothetical protein KC503_25835 [Myxococcales bacterium]|nr:hypothetical protein [Myxococcales bacterium]
MLRLFNRLSATATVTPRKEDVPFFLEVQKFRQGWIWALLIFVALSQVGVVAALGGKLVAVSVGSSIIAIGMLVWFYWMKLVVEVDASGIIIRFRGLFTNRRITFDQIAAFGARTYRPILEYGGWGIRGFSSNRAYNVSGNRGVQLVLDNGDRVLIGSQRADDLARAISEASNREASNF